MIALDSNMKYLSNAGTIQSISHRNAPPNYIGGITAYFQSNSIIHNIVNIGMIKGNNSNFVGGLIGYFADGILAVGSNAGIVEGGGFKGGIVGCLKNGEIVSCINTN